MKQQYKLSITAIRDIDKLFDEGLTKFGKNQAIDYLENLNKLVILLSINPEIGKNRNEIKKGLVSFPFKSHVIFYRTYKNHIRIVRILYGGRDLVKFL